MIGDLPTISSNNYSTAVYHPSSTGGGLGLQAWGDPIDSGDAAGADIFLPKRGPIAQDFRHVQFQQPKEELILANPTRRYVKVIIADTNENVPLADCILYNGEEKLTDLTDQELFFELDIKGLLEKHNEKRVKLIDKKVKDRTEYLEPAKVRDLKMVVVLVAAL